MYLIICMWPIMSRATRPLSIGTLLASCMSRMTEYIAIEDDNMISYPTFCKFGNNWDGRLQ